jgi:hypothetical protein
MDERKQWWSKSIRASARLGPYRPAVEFFARLTGLNRGGSERRTNYEYLCIDSRSMAWRLVLG